MDSTRHRFILAIGLGAAAFLAGCSTTPAAPPAYHATGLGTEETSIPFARMDNSIYDWQADGQIGLWVQDIHRDWYYAKLLGPCYGLDWAVGIGFQPRGNQLDKFSSITVVRERSICQFTSFVHSDPPPSSSKKKKASGTAAESATTPPASK
jgi:hypothetical protein